MNLFRVRNDNPPPRWFATKVDALRDGRSAARDGGWALIERVELYPLTRQTVLNILNGGRFVKQSWVLMEYNHREPSEPVSSPFENRMLS